MSEKPLNKRLFKGAGVVLAGIECSPKIFDFRANGIPDQERVDFFDTLRRGKIPSPSPFHLIFLRISVAIALAIRGGTAFPTCVN